MKALIFGAAGGTGRHLVKQALRQHHHVMAFVRSPADFEMAAANLAVFTGNVTDENAVTRAMKNQDVVISTLGNSRPRQPDPSVVQGMRYIVQAMTRLGVRRLIYQSCLGVAESRRDAGLLFRLAGARRHESVDHDAKEALIRASQLDWTIVRPPTLTNGPRTGQYRSGETLPTRSLLPRLSRADVAEFLLRQVTDSGAIRQVLSVTR